MSNPTHVSHHPAAVVTSANPLVLLITACQAALSQLTEDRPEYVAGDIEQLRAALAAVGDAPPQHLALLRWNDSAAADYRHPATLDSVLVCGILEGESIPDVHEGFWTGRHWCSARTKGTELEVHLKITQVTHYSARPGVPSAAPSETDADAYDFDADKRCPGCGSLKTELTAKGHRCDECEATWT